MATREQIYQALLDRVWAAYAWKNDKALARRLQLWNTVPLENRPALYQFEGGDEGYSWSNNAITKRVIPASWIIYIDAKDPNTPGAIQINNILDAIDAAMQLTGTDLMTGRITLGGLVYSVRIEGQVFRDPGDIDGDGMIRIPVLITVP